MPKKPRPPVLVGAAAATLAAVGKLWGEDDGKDPAAVALGRRGGLKGGPARAKSLTAEERKESACKAAAARWGKRS
ncbi:MAG TPA: hypothetical protein VIX83_11255 [Candidatus Cybelea sp.]